MGTPFLWSGTKLVKAVRDTVGDPVAQSTRWSDEEIVDYLNRAGQQLVLDTEISLETQWDATLVLNTSEYKMPTGFFQDKRVEYRKDTDDILELKNLTIQEYRDSMSRDPTVSGEPQVYYFWRKLGDDLTTYQPTSLFLLPVPNSTAAGKTVRVWGYKIPDALDVDALDKVSEFPATHVEALIRYAAALCKMDDGETSVARVLSAEYEGQVLKIKNVNAKRSRSERPRLIPRRSTLNAQVLPWKGRMI